MISLFERVNVYRNEAFRGKHTTKKFFCIFTAKPFFKIVITVLPLVHLQMASSCYKKLVVKF